MSKKFLIPSLTLLSLLNVSSVSAQIRIQQPEGFGIKPQGNGDAVLTSFITNAIAIIFVIGAIGVVFMVLWGAVQWIISGGDKEAIQKARGRITNALIGLALLAFSFVIINLVGTIVGFNPLGTFKIPSFTGR